ncbi:MAG: thiol peroxidase [Planctomycetota bacterium]|nr:thiol peroxidase [Planctomycetota bacterium]
MSTERSGVITFKGNPLTLIGPEVKVGDAAPDFSAIDSNLEAVNLASSAGKVRLFSVVPSLDTPVCATQTKKFNQEIKNLPDKVQVFTVSADLPFAQARFCGAENIEIPTISDHRELSFGKTYGVLIKELRILARSVFVVDAQDKVCYAQIVPEVVEEPDYAKAIEAAKNAAG